MSETRKHAFLALSVLTREKFSDGAAPSVFEHWACLVIERFAVSSMLAGPLEGSWGHWELPQVAVPLRKNRDSCSVLMDWWVDARGRWCSIALRRLEVVLLVIHGHLGTVIEGVRGVHGIVFLHLHHGPLALSAVVEGARRIHGILFFHLDLHLGRWRQVGRCRTVEVEVQTRKLAHRMFGFREVSGPLVAGRQHVKTKLRKPFSNPHLP